MPAKLTTLLPGLALLALTSLGARAQTPFSATRPSRSARVSTTSSSSFRWRKRPSKCSTRARPLPGWASRRIAGGTRPCTAWAARPRPRCFRRPSGWALRSTTTWRSASLPPFRTRRGPSYNAAIAKGYHQQYSGLTFWTPNINIFRDPRWGRGQETYGEDPTLTGRIGVAFVQGLQGPDPQHLKVAACAKHFAVHSGPEKPAPRLQRRGHAPGLAAKLTCPLFTKPWVKDAKVEAVMCAYNSTNGEPCCGNQYLAASHVLRKQWGFRGHIVSDCWRTGRFLPGP